MSGVHNKMLSDESLNNVESKIKDYQIQLKKDGIDINNYTIIDVIEDLVVCKEVHWLYHHKLTNSKLWDTSCTIV
ncbi:MAG: hypothetical protein U5K54_15275 [Cytophagales bacterium]|nr:hypothetical protein [Cytophagales bacterium]